jgi:Peptidase A4 family
MRRDMRSRHGRSQRLPLRLLIGAVVIFLALTAAGCGSQQVAISLFGPFAGYTWHGKVRQISAAMVVPQLGDCPEHGFAGTWIGAEGHINPRTQVAPFFQVGVNEECTTPDDTYYAFWSSTAEQFHPQWMLDVEPGDTVRLTMRREGGRWLMSARDQTTGIRQSEAVSLAPQTPLGSATWHQEDVTDGSTSSAFPYPRLRVVRFSALRVNNRPPRAAALTTIWMSTDHAIYGPTPLAADAFSIRQLHPSAEDLRYQRIVLREDLADYLFDARLASWSPATPRGTIRAQALDFARDLRRNITSLGSYGWSASVRVPIAHLIAAVGNLRGNVLRLAVRGSSYLGEFKATRNAAVSEAGLAVKKELHMGVTDLSLITIQSYIRAHPG